MAEFDYNPSQHDIRQLIDQIDNVRQRIIYKNNSLGALEPLAPSTALNDITLTLNEDYKGSLKLVYQDFLADSGHIDGTANYHSNGSVTQTMSYTLSDGDTGIAICNMGGYDVTNGGVGYPTIVLTKSTGETQVINTDGFYWGGFRALCTAIPLTKDDTIKVNILGGGQAQNFYFAGLAVYENVNPTITFDAPVFNDYLAVEEGDVLPNRGSPTAGVTSMSYELTAANGIAAVSILDDTKIPSGAKVVVTRSTGKIEEFVAEVIPNAQLTDYKSLNTSISLHLGDTISATIPSSAGLGGNIHISVIVYEDSPQAAIQPSGLTATVARPFTYTVQKPYGWVAACTSWGDIGTHYYVKINNVDRWDEAHSGFIAVRQGDIIDATSTGSANTFIFLVEYD